MPAQPEAYEIVFVVRKEKYGENHGDKPLYARVECPIVHGLFFWQSIDEYRDTAKDGLDALPAAITQHTGFIFEGQLLTAAEGGGPNPNFTKKLYFKSGDTGAQLWTLRDLALDKIRRADKRKSIWVNGQAGNTVAVGALAPTVQGSASADNDATSSYTKYESLAGTMAGVLSANFSLTRMTHDPWFIAKIKTGSDVSQLQFWVGLGSASPGSNAGSAHHVAFRYSTSAGDATWVASTKNGTTQTITSLSPAPALLPNTVYTLMIQIDSANNMACFSFDGCATKQNVTATLPSATVDLGFFAITNPDSLVARSISMSRLFLESN